MKAPVRFPLIPRKLTVKRYIPEPDSNHSFVTIPPCLESPSKVITDSDVAESIVFCAVFEGFNGLKSVSPAARSISKITFPSYAFNSQQSSKINPSFNKIADISVILVISYLAPFCFFFGLVVRTIFLSKKKFEFFINYLSSFECFF